MPSSSPVAERSPLSCRARRELRNVQWLGVGLAEDAGRGSAVHRALAALSEDRNEARKNLKGPVVINRAKAACGKPSIHKKNQKLVSHVRCPQKQTLKGPKSYSLKRLLPARTGHLVKLFLVGRTPVRPRK